MVSPSASVLPLTQDSSDLVRIWTFGSSVMLFTGAVRTTRDPRFSLAGPAGDGTTLVVDPVTRSDQGRFTCRIMVKDEVNLSHEVTVVEAFAVNPVPRSGVLSVDEQSAATLACEVLGDDPAASFQWRREGGAFPHSGEYTFDGDEYLIGNATREDAGHYFCTATSSKGIQHYNR